MQERIRLTRKQLYDLVWQKSVSRLVAEDFAISGVGLAKLCTRHGIPTPPRGYWAQLQAGQNPPRAKLPPGNDALVIELPGPSSENAPPEIRDAVTTEIAEEKEPANGIVVAERLHAPRALVSQAKLALEAAAPAHDGLLRSPKECLALRVSRQIVPRSLRIADALVKALSSRGWQVDSAGGFNRAEFGNVRISFSLEETMSTEHHELPLDLNASYSFHHARQETVRKPSGRLTLSLSEEPRLWNQVRRKWQDSETRTLEEQLNAVVVGMLRLAAAVRVEVARREEAERQAMDRQRKLQQAMEEQKRLAAELAAEKARIETLRNLTARWKESENIRRFVEQARIRGGLSALGLQGAELESWAEWASFQADRIDPFKPNPPSILDDAQRIEQMCDELKWRR